MNFAPPDGTHYTLPATCKQRSKLVDTLKKLYEGWGYQEVGVPVLEHYHPNHSAASKSFKLSDRDSGVLSLRADFTPTIANLVRLHYPNVKGPLRFQYSGKLWHTIAPDMMRNREFAQIGVELVGVSSARADAELIHLAKESIHRIGLVPRIEIGNPGLVKALLDEAEIPIEKHEDFANIIDRKDLSTLQIMLDSLNLSGEIKNALMKLVDLYGDVNVLKQATALTLWPKAQEAVERLIEVIEQFDDTSELLIDLGMARKLRYYTGVTFRAYTPQFGQPLLGGGRYDDALLPHAAGFALGVERVMKALPENGLLNTPLILSSHDKSARVLRKQGYIVERALDSDEAAMTSYANHKGIPYLLTEKELKPLVGTPPEFEKIKAFLGAKE